eukprot:1412143-Lingulodinium_polyedra.AAC.1
MSGQPWTSACHGDVHGGRGEEARSLGGRAPRRGFGGAFHYRGLPAAASGLRPCSGGPAQGQR